MLVYNHHENFGVTKDFYWNWCMGIVVMWWSQHVLNLLWKMQWLHKTGQFTQYQLFIYLQTTVLLCNSYIFFKIETVITKKTKCPRKPPSHLPLLEKFLMLSWYWGNYRNERRGTCHHTNQLHSQSIRCKNDSLSPLCGRFYAYGGSQTLMEM